MTEEQIEQQEREGDAVEAVPSTYGRDWFLMQHVWEADKYGFEKGITIWMGGAVLTGTLIPGRKYFEKVAERFREGAHNGSTKEGREVMDALADNYAIGTEIYDDIPELDKYRPRFLHLANLKTLGPGSGLTNIGHEARIRIERVDAFMLGAMD